MSDPMEIKFPRYFNVDGLPVILVLEGDIVSGFTASGKPYGIGKVLSEGIEVSESEYNKLVSYLTNPA